MNTSVEEPEETIAHTKGRNNINDIKPESKKRQRSKALSSECVERSRQDEREEEVENSLEEEKFRMMSWDVLKDAFERFSEGGDI